MGVWLRVLRVFGISMTITIPVVCTCGRGLLGILSV